MPVLITCSIALIPGEMICLLLVFGLVQKLIKIDEIKVINKINKLTLQIEICHL